MTVPEDHLRRLQMTARVVDSFRNALSSSNKSSEVGEFLVAGLFGMRSEMNFIIFVSL